MVLRLARLLRIVLVSGGAKRLFERLGRVVIVAAVVVFSGATVAYYAEHATNPEFATFGDSLWWGIVTLTTVGYGDIVPQTTLGRWAGTMIMISGIAVVGILAGSLASFFRLGDSQPGDDSSVRSDASSAPTAPLEGEPYQVLAREMAQLREQDGAPDRATGPKPAARLRRSPLGADAAHERFNLGYRRSVPVRDWGAEDKWSDPGSTFGFPGRFSFGPSYRCRCPEGPGPRSPTNRGPPDTWTGRVRRRPGSGSDAGRRTPQRRDRPGADARSPGRSGPA